MACAAACYLAKHHATCNLDDASQHGGTCRVQERLQQGPDITVGRQGHNTSWPSRHVQDCQGKSGKLVTQAMQRARATVLSSHLSCHAAGFGAYIHLLWHQA